MVILKRGVIALVISVLCAPTHAGAMPRFPSIIDLQGASELRLGDSTGVPRGYYDLCRASHFVCRLSSNGSGVSLTKFGKVILSTDAADLLAKTNLAVNRGMREQTDAQRHGVKDRWTVGGAAGDCEDFALTKKAKLMKAGWPSSSLLIAMARTRGGEQHAVLVVRTDKGDLVLDNLTNRIRGWNRVGLRFTSIQSPRDVWVWRSL